MQVIDLETKLFEMFVPEVAALGYELIELELIQGKPRTLRLYIDSDNGIQVDDCADVSRHISVLLDVEDPISGEYNLEVSSPGTERPLRLPEHYARHIGEQAKFKLSQLHEGRKRIKALIESVSEDTVTVRVFANKKDAEGKAFSIPFSKIQKANLAADYEI